jgi:nucleotide-binding universal stress UspA family protein
MFEPQRILCPVDFSPQSGAALRVAGGLARAFGAELTVLHASQIEVPLYFTVAQVSALKSQLRKSAKASRAYLESFVARHLPAGPSYSLLLPEGDPVAEILKALKKSRDVLLVMGTHGRTGLSRIRLGSVMESVLRQMTGPIVTVGPRVKPTAGLGKIRRVLAPVDFSEPAREAFGYAATLAEKTGSELVALHIVEEPSEGQGKKMEGVLCDWVPPEARAHCHVREMVQEGRAAERVISEAKSSRADLIVQGAIPRGYWGALIFGSTTEAIIRSAPCPVLSIIHQGS